MKSNLNTELLEYLQQAGKEITKGYIQKTGNKHCNFGVICHQIFKTFLLLGLLMMK